MMKLLRLAWLSLANRAFTASLCVVMIAASSALLLAVEHIRVSTKQSFQSTLSGTDLIVGARTGSLPLMLYSVFHVGEASNNVSWQSYQRYANAEQVAWSIPISLGDSYQGYRVVGTTDAMFSHYRYGSKRALSFSQGQAFDNVKPQAVVGASVALKLGLKLGQGLVIAHGIGRTGFLKHEHAAQTLVGILAPTGTPVDQSVFVNLRAIDSMHERFPGMAPAVKPAPDVHEDHDDHDHDESDHHDEAHEDDHAHEPKAITAFFIGLKNRRTTFGFQQRINQDPNEPLLAILPGVTLQQLWQLVGVAESALSAVAIAVVITGLLGMMMALWSTLEQRRREMAILRSVGAKTWQIVALLLLESTVLCAIGLAVGAAILTGGLVLAAPWLAAEYGLFLELNWLGKPTLILLASIFVASFILALIPALGAYRRALADGLSVKF